MYNSDEEIIDELVQSSDDENNNKLERKYDIERIIMERGENLFAKNTKNTKKSKIDNTGEITGKEFSIDETEKGMPVRTFHDKMNMIERVPKSSEYVTNKYLDFDLFDKQANISEKVPYYDPVFTNIDKNFAEIEDIDYDGIKKSNAQNNAQNNTMNQDILITNNLNSFTFVFFDKFISHMNGQKPMIVSPLNLLSIFNTLYIGSKSNTQQELSDFFSLSDKNSSSIYFKNKDIPGLNMILMPNNVTINNAFLKNYTNQNNAVLNYKIQDFQKINNIYGRATNNKINNIVNSNVLINPNIIILSGMYYNLKIRGFTKKILFNKSRKINFIVQKNVKHNYFEDQNCQILEMDDGKYNFGIMLSKNKITVNLFNYYISQLKEKNINIVAIPEFKIESKYKIDNLFKKYGLDNIYHQINLSDMIETKDNLFVSDIIYNNIFELTCIQNNMSLQQNSSNINFIANIPFIFYHRDKNNNLINFIGEFN